MSDSNVRFAHITDISNKPVLQVVVNVDHVAYVVKKSDGVHKVVLTNKITFEISVEDHESIFSLKEAGIHLY